MLTKDQKEDRTMAVHIGQTVMVLIGVMIMMIVVANSIG